MELSKLPKTTARKKKRLGRGYGSAKGGHTVGRGTKGLKVRGKVPLTFAGTKTKKSFLKRLPVRRGKGKLRPLKPKPLTVNVKYLNLLSKNTTVNLDSLVKAKIVGEKEARQFGIKILGEGKLDLPLKVELPCSKGAVKKIEKAGGKVVKKTKARSQVKAKKPKTKNKK